jgi:hypothetical protein
MTGSEIRNEVGKAMASLERRNGVDWSQVCHKLRR